MANFAMRFFCNFQALCVIANAATFSSFANTTTTNELIASNSTTSGTTSDSFSTLDATTTLLLSSRTTSNVLSESLTSSLGSPLRSQSSLELLNATKNSIGIITPTLSSVLPTLSGSLVSSSPLQQLKGANISDSIFPTPFGSVLNSSQTGSQDAPVQSSSLPLNSTSVPVPVQLNATAQMATNSTNLRAQTPIYSNLTIGTAFPFSNVTNSSTSIQSCSINYTTTMSIGTEVPRVGSGSAYAEACNLVHATYEMISYYSQSVLWPITGSAPPPVTQGDYLPTTTVEPIYPGDPTDLNNGVTTIWRNSTIYSTYTLCDGVPRINYALPPVVSYYSFTSTIATPPVCAVYGITTGQEECARYPPPTTTYPASYWCGVNVDWPKCRIPPTDCVELMRTWESMRRDPASSTSEFWYSPRCDMVTNLPGTCTITGNSIQLIYFPVPSTVSRDLCATAPPLPGASLVTSNITNEAVASVVSGGFTFWNTKVYISFDRVVAYSRNDWGLFPNLTQVGGVKTHIIVSMNSGDLSSIRYPDFNTPYPMNYADFNSPIPYSALAGMYDCYLGNCATISMDYTPQLAVPDVVRQLDSAWADCALDWRGLYDPPHALTPAEMVLAPATPLALPGHTATVDAPISTAPMTASSTTSTTSPSGPGASTNGAIIVPTTQGASPTAQTASSYTASGGSQPAIQNPQAIVVVGSQTAIASGGVLIIGTATAYAGGPAITVGGSQISIASAGVVIADLTATSMIAFSQSNSPPAPTSPPSVQLVAVFDANGTPVTASAYVGNPSTVLISGTALVVGGPPITVSGQQVILAVNGLVIGSSTVPLTVASTQVDVQDATITIGGQVIIARQLPGAPNLVVVGSQTLTINGPAATLSGNVVNALPGAIIVDGTGAPFSAHTGSGFTLIAAGQDFSVVRLPDGTVLVSGQTLAKGAPPTIISGQSFQLDEAGLFVNGQIIPGAVSLSPTSSFTMVGAYILSALGIDPSATVSAPSSILASSSGIPTSSAVNSINAAPGTFAETYPSISASTPPSVALPAVKGVKGGASRAGWSSLFGVAAIVSMLLQCF